MSYASGINFILGPRFDSVASVSATISINLTEPKFVIFKDVTIHIGNCLYPGIVTLYKQGGSSKLMPFLLGKF